MFFVSLILAGALAIYVIRCLFATGCCELAMTPALPKSDTDSVGNSGMISADGIGAAGRDRRPRAGPPSSACRRLGQGPARRIQNAFLAVAFDDVTWRRTIAETCKTNCCNQNVLFNLDPKPNRERGQSTLILCCDNER